MKIQIGNGDEVYGTIATSSIGLTYQGPRIKVLMGMVKERHKRHSQMSDEAFLEWMLEQLQGRTWAKKITTDDAAQRMMAPPFAAAAENGGNQHRSNSVVSKS